MHPELRGRAQKLAAFLIALAVLVAALAAGLYVLSRSDSVPGTSAVSEEDKLRVLARLRAEPRASVGERAEVLSNLSGVSAASAERVSEEEKLRTLETLRAR